MKLFGVEEVTANCAVATVFCLVTPAPPLVGVNWIIFACGDLDVDTRNVAPKKKFLFVN